MSLLQTPSSPGLPYVHNIKAVAPEDQGMYTCVARNVVGRAYAAAYLQVNTAAPGHERWALTLNSVWNSPELNLTKFPYSPF